MLIATDYARKMALDMRMIDPHYEDHPDNKASHCAKMIAEYYHRYDEIPLHWIGNTPQQNKAVSLGVPFNEGELYPEHTLQLMTDKGEMLPTVAVGSLITFFIVSRTV